MYYIYEYTRTDPGVCVSVCVCVVLTILTGQMLGLPIPLFCYWFTATNGGIFAGSDSQSPL